MYGNRNVCVLFLYPTCGRNILSNMHKICAQIYADVYVKWSLNLSDINENLCSSKLYLHKNRNKVLSFEAIWIVRYQSMNVK